MNDTQPICEDGTLLVAYLYGECDDTDRARLESHLASCGACREELDGLRGARSQLAAWSPPAGGVDLRVVRADEAGGRSRPGRLWAWGLAAAAVLVLAAGAAIANLELTLGADGVVVRTGWQRAGALASSPGGEQPWRDELRAVEQRLRDAIAASQASVARSPEDRTTPTPAPVATSVLTEDEVSGRIGAAVRESEARQRRELALRMAQLTRELDTQRRSDLVRIEYGLGQLEGATGAEVARQRELLNYLVTVSQRR
jgi:hypothetical protein